MYLQLIGQSIILYSHATEFFWIRWHDYTKWYLLNWVYLASSSDDFVIHFQTVCLQLTLLSMRLALSLLAIPVLAASQEIGWKESRFGDKEKKMLMDALTPNGTPSDVLIPKMCFKREKTTCVNSPRNADTDFLFAFVGCPKDNCGPTCTESYHVIQISQTPTRTRNIKTVATESDLEESCETLATFW